MKLFVVFLLTLYSAPHLRAEELIDKVMHRVRIEKKLEELGYSKWFKVQQLLVEQISLAAQAQIKAAEHKNELLSLRDDLGDLRELQSDLVKAKAEEDPEEAKALALTYETKNAGIEEKIANVKKEQIALHKIAQKHKKLYQQLGGVEKELRKKVDVNREEINGLIPELKALQGTIKELDEEPRQKSDIR